MGVVGKQHSRYGRDGNCKANQETQSEDVRLHRRGHRGSGLR